VVFVFGGTSDGATPEPGFFALDARVGHESWTKLERAGEPPLRAGAIGFWDPWTRTATCGLGSITDWTSFGPASRR
jgi:hypothetical protein